MIPDDPTINDLLRDPMTQAIMRADGVNPMEFEALLRALAARLARPADRANDNIVDVHVHDAERMPFDRNAVGRRPLPMSLSRGEASSRLAARPSIRSQLGGVS
jgi:hypothetical protein